ncbi:MAG: response regulator transcription factor [Acidiferrobacteraceae bacterium]
MRSGTRVSAGVGVRETRRKEAGVLLGAKPSRQLLLIEDEAVAAQALVQSLQAIGITCRWVATFEEAQTAWKEATYDAVVTDIMLDQGRPDGLALLKKIEQGGMPMPVVVISAFADQARVKEALNHGAAYLLEKPFTAMELKRVLERLWEEPRGLIGARERALSQATLTNKECEVARLLLKGLSTQEMAKLTGNSEKTLKQHISTIYEKCGVSSRTEFFHYIFPT